MYRAMTFRLSPQCGRSAGDLTLGYLPQVEFSIMWGRAQSWAFTISVSPQGGAYNRALKIKSLALLCLVGGLGCDYK